MHRRVGIARIPGVVDGLRRIRALRSIKGKTAERVAMIELVELRLAELAAQLDLVLADHPRKVIGEVAGDIVAAFRRRLADGIEAP